MSMKETIELQEKTIERLQEKNDSLRDEMTELKEKLRHYEVAVAAVKWLWDQAQKQNEFQL